MKTKNVTSLVLLLLACTFMSFTPEKPGKLIVNYSFDNIVKDYDHKSKTVVYIDGKQVGESSEKLQSEPNSVEVDVPQGRHEVRIVNLANYEGDWEEHTIANDYSIDCLYERTIKIKKKTKVTLVFDIDAGTTAKVK